jgi:hypothetical protein
MVVGPLAHNNTVFLKWCPFEGYSQLLKKILSQIYFGAFDENAVETVCCAFVENSMKFVLSWNTWNGTMPFAKYAE